VIDFVLSAGARPPGPARRGGPHRRRRPRPTNESGDSRPSFRLSLRTATRRRKNCDSWRAARGFQTGGGASGLWGYALAQRGRGLGDQATSKPAACRGPRRRRHARFVWKDLGRRRWRKNHGESDAIEPAIGHVRSDGRRGFARRCDRCRPRGADEAGYAVEHPAAAPAKAEAYYLGRAVRLVGGFRIQARRRPTRSCGRCRSSHKDSLMRSLPGVRPRRDHQSVAFVVLGPETRGRGSNLSAVGIARDQTAP